MFGADKTVLELVGDNQVEILVDGVSRGIQSYDSVKIDVSPEMKITFDLPDISTTVCLAAPMEVATIQYRLELPANLWFVSNGWYTKIIEGEYEVTGECVTFNYIHTQLFGGKTLPIAAEARESDLIIGNRI